MAQRNGRNGLIDQLIANWNVGRNGWMLIDYTDEAIKGKREPKGVADPHLHKRRELHVSRIGKGMTQEYQERVNGGTRGVHLLFDPNGGIERGFGRRGTRAQQAHQTC